MTNNKSKKCRILRILCRNIGKEELQWRKNIAGKYSTRKLKEFYLGVGRDPWERKIKDMWNMMVLSSQDWKPGDKKEQLFDECIQWLFSLGTDSTRLVFSPVLSMKQIKRLKREPFVRANMIVSLKCVLMNYGLIWDVSDQDSLYDYFGSESRDIYSLIWQQERKLHYVRLYRIIKSLRLFGLDGHADDMIKRLKGLIK